MNDLFQTLGQIALKKFMADKTAVLEFRTVRELAPEEVAALYGLQNQEGYMLFKTTAIEDKDVAALPDIGYRPLEPGKKTRSQELRSALWKLWKNTREDQESFEVFYDREMGQIIAKVDELAT